MWNQWLLRTVRSAPGDLAGSTREENIVNVALTVAAVLAVIIYVIGRQLRGEPLRAKRVLVVPAVLAVVGLVDLSGSKGVNAADIACIIASALLATGIGVAQGAKMQLELRDGGLWGQMPVRSLWLWGALIVSRVAVTVVAVPLGAHIASSTGSILLMLGVNRLAQAAVITLRALAAGIPFAAEKDGKTLLPGLLGQPTPPPPGPLGR
jgi:hypothetical protein